MPRAAVFPHKANSRSPSLAGHSSERQARTSCKRGIGSCRSNPVRYSTNPAILISPSSTPSITKVSRWEPARHLCHSGVWTVTRSKRPESGMSRNSRMIVSLEAWAGQCERSAWLFPMPGSPQRTRQPASLASNCAVVRRCALLCFPMKSSSGSDRKPSERSHAPPTVMLAFNGTQKRVHGKIVRSVTCSGCDMLWGAG